MTSKKLGFRVSRVRDRVCVGVRVRPSCRSSGQSVTIGGQRRGINIAPCTPPDHDVSFQRETNE